MSAQLGNVTHNTRELGGNRLMFLVLVTLLFIGIETLLTLPSITYNVNSLQNYATLNAPYQPDFLLPIDIGSFILWIILPFVLCCFASIFPPPKRLLNPILIQIGSMAIVTLVFVTRVAAIKGLVVTTQMLAIFLFLFGFSAILAFTISLIQYAIVVLVIRMYYEDSSRVSYVINMKPKEILRKLGSSFLDTWSFNRQRDVGETWLLERNDNDRCLLIEIGSHPQENEKSILATVAYQIEHSWIIKSDAASNLRQKIVEDIEDRLQIKFMDNHADLDDPISRLANTNVKDKAQSRIEVAWGLLRKLDRIYQTSLALTTFLLITLSVAYFYFNTLLNISSDTYVIVAITLIFALLVEIGFPLREEISKKKIEELEI